MLHKILKFVLGSLYNPQNVAQQRLNTYKHAQKERELMRREAKIGSEVFGPVPAGHQREFFCFDSVTWVWHEKWHDASGQTHGTYTQYEFQPRGVLKTVNGVVKGFVADQELVRLLDAIDIYHKRVTTEIYGYRSALATS